MLLSYFLSILKKKILSLFSGNENFVFKIHIMVTKHSIVVLRLLKLNQIYQAFKAALRFGMIDHKTLQFFTGRYPTKEAANN